MDLLALHEQNVFHLHLTEDQGWRLQIDRYPELTAVGAWRDDGDGARYGGSYSRAEALDVVGFRDRVAWPRAGGADRLPTSGLHRRPLRSHAGVGVFDDVICVGNDEAIGFLEVVFDEVLDIFPSPFIHVGGDECPKVRWKECPRCQARMQQEGMADEDALQSWTIRHFDRYLADRGRRLVGWDEILEGGLAPGATVMSWRGVAGGLAASRAGHDVVMSPQTHVYLDYKHYEGADEPGRLGVSSLENCYGSDPTIPEMTRPATYSACRPTSGRKASTHPPLFSPGGKARCDGCPLLPGPCDLG
ncbi:MAG: family 20 glycosylhydrolase [Candidatus Latescibacterota bacterium]